MTTDEPKAKSNWWDAFPASRRTPALLTRDIALAHLTSGSLLLVDVRRTDYEGGSIQGSLNIPAQSFYWNRAVLYDLCKRAGVKQVAFYCDTSVCIIFKWPDIFVSPDPADGSLYTGASNGRGPRCSAWFADYLAEKGEDEIQSLTLAGGIKGWVKAGESYTKKMHGFEPEYWKQFDQAK